MPMFGLHQQTELKVWDLAFAQAEAAGYRRTSCKGKPANPLAATAYAAGFMAGAFLGSLPSWIQDVALEPHVEQWIQDGYAASQSLSGQYIGQPYEANQGDVNSSGA